MSTAALTCCSATVSRSAEVPILSRPCLIDRPIDSRRQGAMRRIGTMSIMLDEELAAAPDTALHGDQGSLMLAAGWPMASPVSSTRGETTPQTREREAPPRPVRAGQNRGQITQESWSNVPGIAVKCAGIRRCRHLCSRLPGCPGKTSTGCSILSPRGMVRRRYVSLRRRLLGDDGCVDHWRRVQRCLSITPTTTTRLQG